LYLTKFLRGKLDLVVLQASVAPLASHVSNHAKKFAHVTVKELVVVFNYVLQILHTMLHHFHGLETFIDRRVEIPDGLTASSTTHRMQSEGVVVAIVSTIVPTIVATSIVITTIAVAVGAFGCPLLGLLILNVEVVSSTGLRDARAPVGTHPLQRMRAVLLTGSLSSHRIASSIDGSLASSFNSKLLGDTMAAA
jgi:hypothetical protein